MRVAAYCRVSTDKGDQLNSLAAQKAFFEEFAQKNGHTLVRIYADEGISGTKIKNRKEFLRLLEDAKTEAFDLVAVKDISRFARNTVDLLQSTRALKARGIDTFFLTSSQTVLGNSEFVLTVFGALAQEESANTSKRVKFGKRLNAQKGRVPNLVYGYDKKNGDYFDMAVNPDEAAVVRRIFSLYTEEGYGAGRIASLLNAQGARTKRGCAFTQTAVSRILKNPLYTGRILNGKEEVADFLTGQRRALAPEEWLVTDRPHLRIVEDAVFLRAQQAAAGRRVQQLEQGRRQTSAHLLSALLTCAACGRAFRRLSRTYQNTYVRWVCGKRNSCGAESCENRTAVEEETLLRALLGHFLSLLEPVPKAAQRIRREFLRLQDGPGMDPEGQRREMQRLARSRERLLTLYENDLISLEELKPKLTQIQKALREADRHASPASRAEEPAAGFEPAALLRPDYLTNALLREAVESITVAADGQVVVTLAQFAAPAVPNPHIHT